MNYSDSLVILDWDNTLFPTTWISEKSANLNDDAHRKIYTVQLKTLDIVLCELLKKIRENAKIIIVTNAMPIWIKISSSVLPKTHEILKNIRIVSARKEYQDKSNDIWDWKKLAFIRESHLELSDCSFKNILSIGDAHYEYKALTELFHIHPDPKVLKTIKLMDEPDLNHLIDQLKVLNKGIEEIIHHPDHLDLKFASLNSITP